MFRLLSFAFTHIEQEQIAAVTVRLKYIYFLWQVSTICYDFEIKVQGGVGLINDCDGKSTNWQQYSESESVSEFQIHWKRGKVRIKPSWICQLLALESSGGASFLIFFCILFHILNFSFIFFTDYSCKVASVEEK